MADEIQKLPTKLKDILPYLRVMYNYFFTALKLDKEDVAETKRTGVPCPNPSGNIKNFFKLFWVPLAILIIMVIGLYYFLVPKTKSRYADGRKSHHGWNKYGKRY